jgi:hypothetical protein
VAPLTGDHSSTRYREPAGHPDHVRAVLRAGDRRARERAGDKVAAARTAIGLLPMLDQERSTFVDRRDSGAIDDEVLRRVLRRLDLEEAMLGRDEG